jgi:hypothetical protein
MATNTNNIEDEVRRRAYELWEQYAWKDASTIQEVRDIGRKAGARGFAFTRFPEDLQVDEQGWLVLDQGFG